MTSKHKKIELGCNTLAEVAAAYERAADSVRRLEDGWYDGVSAEYHQHSSAQMKLYAIREIRALATPEQTAALDAVRAEAWEQGMREAAGIAAKALERAEGHELASGWTISTMRLNGLGLSAGDWASECTLEAIEVIALEAEKGCTSAILAAITKGDKA